MQLHQQAALYQQSAAVLAQADDLSKDLTKVQAHDQNWVRGSNIVCNVCPDHVHIQRPISVFCICDSH